MIVKKLVRKNKSLKKKKMNSDWKSINWQYLYFSITEENRKLKKQIEVLESIVRIQLPIIGDKK